MLLLILVLSMVNGSVQAHPWQSLYGDSLLFDVYRDGEQVGHYLTEFRDNSSGWDVEARMELNIEWLFWTYRYRYSALENWRQGQLQRVQAQVDRNGDENMIAFERNGNWLESGNGDQARLPILATHHYDVDVINSSQVANTLTGRINTITVTPMGLDSLLIEGKTVQAQRYQYQGDLRQTSVWYDLKGRWVGLRFTDQRGAEMEFRCRRCGQGAKL